MPADGATRDSSFLRPLMHEMRAHDFSHRLPRFDVKCIIY